MATSEHHKICDLIDTEFDHWTAENQEKIYLLEVKSKSDGSANIFFSIFGENEFTLILPAGYPKITDEKIVVEATTPSLQSWCTELTMYLNSSTSPCLQDILTKAVQLYLPHRRNSCSSNSSLSEASESDDEMDVEEAMDEDTMISDGIDDDDTAFTTEWEISLAHKKKRWAKKEAEIRAKLRNSVSTSGDNAFSEQKANTRQIFSTDASSGVLVNDLIKIISQEQEEGIIATPIHDNIYSWQVRLFNFEPGSALDDDLHEIEKTFHYNYIELQLDFTMDLYPFFPPAMKVIRPRMKGAMMQRITNLEVLKLSYWNPTDDMLSILHQVKNVLQKWARLEVTCIRNDMNLFPSGSYLNIDHQLLKLAMVSEVYPRANTEFELQFDKISTSNLSLKKVTDYWAPGTGFGHGKNSTWDVKAHVAAQKQKDIEIQDVLMKIKIEIENFSKDGNSTISSIVSRTRSDDVMEDQLSDVLNMNREEDLYSVIEGSALIPFLETNLNSTSFLEICRHEKLYVTIANVVREIAHHPQLIDLLGPLPQQRISILNCLQSIKDEALLVLSRFEKLAYEMPKSSSDKKQTITEHQLAKDFVALHDAVLQLFKAHSNIKHNPSSTGVLYSNEKDKNDEELNYKLHLKALQLDNCNFIVKGTHTHLYFSKMSKCLLPKSSQAFRIAQDIASLANSLPLNSSSSIFIRVDDKRCTLLKILITGPEDTPYAGGCFIFDLHFPERYPAVPPSILLKTTGNGAVRFNPNLYNTGKVCLSLLGTWEGQQGEKWNETSTLLQVLVSIQSLILVPEPYFNEPGYERWIGTPQGSENSKRYNEEVQRNNLQWAVLEQIHNPTPEFKDVIQMHFYFLRNKLIKEISEWANESTNSRLKSLVQTVVSELRNLPHPSSNQQ